MRLNNPTKSFSSFPFFLIPLMILFFLTNTATSKNTTIPVNVGLVLDINGEDGKIALSCINMSLSDFYNSNSHYKTRLLLNTRDSKGDVVAAAAAALDLLNNVQVQAILGPEKSMQTNFIIQLGNKSQVPILSFSATSPSLTSIRSPYFFRGSLNDSSQAGAITAIIKAFGWREAVPIYVDNQYGEEMIPSLTDALQAIDTRVPYRSVISPLATDDQIEKELYKLFTMQTRVFILHMLPSLGSRIFEKANEIGLMNKGCVWIMTDGMTNLLRTLEPSVIDSMQGVIGVGPHVPKTKALENFRVRWKRNFLQENPSIVDVELNIFGLLAYDATRALAEAVEKAGITSFGFDKTNVSRNATDLEAFGISQNGPKLLQALSSARFKGLTGDYIFVDGQLQSSAFEIINVNNGARGVGFWTPEKGLTQKLSSNSTTKSKLKPIIWPGDSTSDPKGWEVPTNEKKLRIGVPVKKGFSDFVNVTIDPKTQEPTSVTGYCVDVFKAVIQELPYAVAYDFVPYGQPDGSSSGSYNDLVYQVFLGEFDAVVGDITIVFNRSNYVDFTLPYTESGVSMIVPIKDSKKRNAWVFLQPLTWDLWVTCFCFFIFIGFVVWVLEHRVNEDFRGPAGQQVGTSFWFSFSTMVFSQRERVISNLARIVVIVWCFVVLILTQSYTASLTSLLTVQQLQPTITDVKMLIKRGDNVGYQKGSFVLGILKQLGFDERKLVVYNSPEDCHELFQKGSVNGGIAAAFDEIPYMKLLIGQYCSKYAMIEPKFKTAGFGFVFPLHSPLVHDVSKAILNVTEGDKMKEIEDAWFKKHSSCPDASTVVSSRSLGLNSFWGLFLIAGVAAILALIIFMAVFIHQHWNVLKNSESSFLSRIRFFLKIFVSRDLSAHIFKDKGGMQVHSMDATEASPGSCYPASPSSYSQHADSHFCFCGEQGTPRTEYGNSNHNPNSQAQAPLEIVSAVELTIPDQEIATPSSS
ncbi:glutamate receptor 2.7 [Citrus sinensis]|uniref:Glutamate receptor 2.7 n=4 Tax=Citrus sinensis TaxID=2711 RepID=A0ACB8NKI9_CITSI|nr:glutamate receptor 2.7 [Citrus sinensis]KAH9798633.1 glutamate receptor 2.7 [Citrus sinensis]